MQCCDYTEVTLCITEVTLVVVMFVGTIITLALPRAAFQVCSGCSEGVPCPGCV